MMITSGRRRRCARGPTTLLLSVALAGAMTRVAAACDICAIYTADQTREGRAGFTLGVAEQYSHFGTERLDGDAVTLPAHEHLDSAVTQFLLRYAPTPRIGVQLTVPVVDRRFTRIRDHRLEHGTESGVGDATLLGQLVAYRAVVGDAMFRFSLLGGLKFPTGDSARLAEELPAASAAVRRPRHGVPSEPGGGLPAEGGLHGHDLALGSGSVDGIVGGQLFWSWGRAFVTAGMQYAIRTPGDFDYRYANDLTWSGGPGWFLLLDHDYSIGVQGALSGETKGKDTQAGQKAGDTAITALYAGPALTFTWRGALAADAGVDLPVIQHNTALQLVPDVRVRGGLSWHF